MPFALSRLAVATAAASLFVVPNVPAQAQQSRTIEEIVVTARQQEETLQDVPVTVTALSEEDLRRYNVTKLSDAANLVPNFQIYQTGSGNGSVLRLRGIGSSDISAAFDQSVAINVDGVVVNIGRFIHNSYMDMGQLEVLKGPQSLYFGKSATAGVVSVTSKNPGEEFELEGMVAYEHEFDQMYYEGIISGPITETLGARLAVGYSKANDRWENLWPGVANQMRGEENINLRLTTVWDPSDTLSFNLKYAFSEYKNDGPWNMEETCPEGVVQPTAIPSAATAFVVFPGIDDCKLNGNMSANDLLPVLAVGLPYGADDGVPFLEQQTHFISLRGDWDINDSFSLRSTTGYVDLDHVDLGVYDGNAGVFGGLHRNTYESFSQEFTLRSNFDGAFNFMLGAYYQDVEQRFEAYQYAFNLALVPNFLNFTPEGQERSVLLGFDPTPGTTFGPDPSTGRGSDYWRFHFLDTEVYSAFLAGYYSITDDLELTAGVRYTKEEKKGRIDLPYFHAGAAIFGFGGFTEVEGLEFSDKNWSPEVALNYYVTPEISVFAAYKQGFKSGGVDNSALPTNALNPQSPNFDGFDFLYYDSEEAEGFEVGMKGRFLENSLRVNATAFYYTYTDLQVQLFDAINIQFETLNASELLSRGIEADWLWLTPTDGLSIRGNLAYTDTGYEKDFFNAGGENLNGQSSPGSAKLAGALGFSYDMGIGTGGWRSEWSTDARYNSGYNWTNTLNPYTQSSFWTLDTALRFYSADYRYELSFIGRNLTDKIVAQGGGNRPGACVDNQAAIPGNCRVGAIANDQDQVTYTTFGRSLTAQFRVRF
ncbi:MAG: TonB-dependent receptor [Gammaproteobacteria bacterium]|nr:TonB-dependent receptor [Gammaproteobacteria bacterium]